MYFIKLFLGENNQEEIELKWNHLTNATDVSSFRAEIFAFISGS